MRWLVFFVAFSVLAQEDAITVYERLVRASPANVEMRMDLCVALFSAKRYREAMDQAQEVLRRRPGLWKAELFLGASHVELGEFEAALDPLRRVIAAQPTDRNARAMLGKALVGHADALARNGRHADAAKDWREALRLTPGDAHLRSGLAWSLFKARDYAAALPLIDEMIAANPDTAEPQFLKGACLLNMERLEEDIPYLEKAVKSDPTMLSAHAALGQSLLRTGKSEAAIPHLEAALPMDKDGGGHFQLFRAYTLAGHPDEARRAFEEYLRLANR